MMMNYLQIMKHDMDDYKVCKEVYNEINFEEHPYLDELRDWAGKAETIREQMANSFVSPESNNTPCIVCI